MISTWPSRIAIDCYRDALANAKAWRRNPHKGKRPRVKKLSMLIHQGSVYRKARNVLEDWARKAPLKIARLAL